MRTRKEIERDNDNLEEASSNEVVKTVRMHLQLEVLLDIRDQLNDLHVDIQNIALKNN